MTSRRLSALAALALLSGCDFVRGYAQGPSAAMESYRAASPALAEEGEAQFALGDFRGLSTDTLQTNAVPWKIAATALLQAEKAQHGGELSRDRLPRILQRFGFVQPERVANWKDAPLASLQPLGLTRGQMKRSVPTISLEVANIGCASCHAGVSYDAEGNPTREVWLGLPNTSLDLERYSVTLYREIKRAVQDEQALLRDVRQLFPETSADELSTIERFVIPQAKKQFAEHPQQDRPTPFSNGGPGLTNGVGALKWQLHALDGAQFHADETGFTAVPDLSARGFKTALLCDGTYAPKGEERFHPMRAEEVTRAHLDSLASVVAFFNVSIMGLHPDVAEEGIPQAKAILQFIARYHPPRFPGHVDEAKAKQGRALFQENCAECHGVFSEGVRDVQLVSYPNKLVPLAEVGSDPNRVRVVDEKAEKALNLASYERRLVAANTGGYMAPPLVGVWATAPYLHNGSVPTLWHLLHPEQRPARFQVGGHKLDLERVGIAGEADAEGVYRYPQGYAPWADAQLYDTRTPGRSNAGHESFFDALEEDEKAALIEYLKVL